MQPPIQEYIPSNGLNVQVVFGCPSKSCEGHGICNIIHYSPVLLAHNSCCPKFAALLTNPAADQITLKIFRARLSQSITKRYFSLPFFQMDDSFPLPNFVQYFYAFPKAATIPSGKHPIAKTRDFFIIKFNGLVAVVD